MCRFLLFWISLIVCAASSAEGLFRHPHARFAGAPVPRVPILVQQQIQQHKQHRQQRHILQVIPETTDIEYISSSSVEYIPAESSDTEYMIVSSSSTDYISLPGNTDEAEYTSPVDSQEGEAFLSSSLDPYVPDGWNWISDTEHETNDPQEDNSENLEEIEVSSANLNVLRVVSILFYIFMFAPMYFLLVL